MADYLTKNIRNIALLGHGSEGKTTLTEAMLYAAGLIDRQGKVEDGSTISDYDPEEVKRAISISASIAPIDWKGNKINVIDVPGYFDFIGESIAALRVVETAGIVVGASVDICWLIFLKDTNIYEILPGFVAGALAAVVAAKLAGDPSEEITRQYDAAVAYDD